MIETFIDVIQEVWIDLQQGQLPNLGGWNYMLMAFFLMIQGRASALIGGIAAATGSLNLGLIILVALAARAIVDLFWYRVGTTGLINRISGRGSSSDRFVGSVNEELNNRPTRVILLSKFTGGLSVPVVVAIGNAGVPLRRWLPASFAGELLWTLPLLLVGFFATEAVSGVKGGLVYLSLGLTSLILFGFLLRSIRTGLSDRS
jgi:membrane protein DedA with SNARE-associated domain